MNTFAAKMGNLPGLKWGLFCLLSSMLLGVFDLRAAAHPKNLPVVPKWERFEHEFSSFADYEHPLQDVRLTVQFTSPLGETTRIDGFWDGGRTWRVRFSPNQPGRWKFKSTCSDAANLGLNDQTGEFMCSATLSQSRFYQHGLIRVALDRQHLEHADGTPFFWLADTAWNGARESDPKNWEIYALVRSSQNFSVAQWSAAPGVDDKGQSALTGFPDRIGVNPDYFRRIDSKIAILSQVGILSAIAPLTPASPEASALPDDQAALLVRYVVARWGADPVAWLFPVEKGSREMGRWRKICHEVFAGAPHAPVLVYSTDDPQVLTEFGNEDWVDLLGFQVPLRSQDESLVSALGGAANAIGSKSLPHPLIGFTPTENAPSTQAGQRISAAQIRQSAYGGLLSGQVTGISYGGHGVANWDTTVEPKAEDKLGAGLPLWHKSMFMPGAKQMGHIANVLSAVDFWQLRPEPKLIAGASNAAQVARKVLAASTPGKGLALVYVAEDRMLELAEDQLPHVPAVTWYNPRRGENSPAVAVVVQHTCQFPTPEPGDWLLMLKAGK